MLKVSNRKYPHEHLSVEKKIVNSNIEHILMAAIVGDARHISQ